MTTSPTWTGDRKSSRSIDAVTTAPPAWRIAATPAHTSIHCIMTPPNRTPADAVGVHRHHDLRHLDARSRGREDVVHVGLTVGYHRVRCPSDLRSVRRVRACSSARAARSIRRSSIRIGIPFDLGSRRGLLGARSATRPGRRRSAVAVLDTASPVTIFDVAGPETHRRLAGVELIGAGTGVPRARFDAVRALVTPPAPSAWARRAAIGAVIGGDLLSLHALRVDVSAASLRIFPNVAGDDTKLADCLPGLVQHPAGRRRPVPARQRHRALPRVAHRAVGVPGAPARLRPAPAPVRAAPTPCSWSRRRCDRWSSRAPPSSA